MLQAPRQQVHAWTSDMQLVGEEEFELPSSRAATDSAS
jgi:hypothetical protein